MVPALWWRRGAAGMTNLAQFSQSPRVGLDALLDSTVSICIEQLAQVLDLAADLGSGIGVAHHAATVCLVKTVGLALDVHVACECLGNRRKGPVRLETAAARARDERIAGDTRLGMVGAAEAAIDDQQLALGADGCSPLVVLTACAR